MLLPWIVIETQRKRQQQTREAQYLRRARDVSVCTLACQPPIARCNIQQGLDRLILYLLHRDFVSLLLVSLCCLWVTASSSLRHNNVVVNGKQRPDTLSQVQLHKNGEREKKQWDLGEKGKTSRGSTGRLKPLSPTSYLKVPYCTKFPSPMFS